MGKERIFYISDTHFGHANVIRYDKRPFDSVEYMDDVLIRSWNSVVTDRDTVYILGDFSWYKEEQTLSILNKLIGRKILIRGNHDRISPKVARKFSKICDYLEINDNGQCVILSHYPMPFRNGQFRDSVHLYGHVHNTLQWELYEKIREGLKQTQGIPMRMYNVGCMMEWMDYFPRMLEEIEYFIKNCMGGERK